MRAVFRPIPALVGGGICRSLGQRAEFPVDPAARAFCLGRVVADEAELLTLAVAPEARRMGHGPRLLGEFARAADSGADQAFSRGRLGQCPGHCALYRETAGPNALSGAAIMHPGSTP